MSMQTYKSGDVLYRAEDKITSLDILMKGTVTVAYPYGSLTLEKGDVLGIMDVGYDVHSFTYIASSDIAFIEYPYSGDASLPTLLKENKDLSVLFSSSMTKQVCQIIDQIVFIQFESDNLYHFILDSYTDYKTLCTNYSLSAKTLPEFSELMPIDTENTFPSWLSNYYENIRGLSVEDSRLFFQKNLGFSTGYLLRAGHDIHTALLLCEEYATYNTEAAHLLLNEDRLDFFDLYTELHYKATLKNDFDTPLIPIINKLMIYLEGLSAVDSSLYEKRVAEYQLQIQHVESTLAKNNTELEEHENIAQEVAHSLDVILEYACCTDDITNQFRKSIETYRRITDKTAADDTLDLLHKTITSLFYQVYHAAFKVSLTEKNIPIIVKMFLYFGYVDETLAGIDNSLYLYSVSKYLKDNSEHGIYTLYDWFLAIYSGKKEPSRNEFDVDYVSHLHTLKVNSKIDAATEAAMLQDGLERVSFELQNMFPIVNKMAFGRITNYCPVLSEHNILKNLSDTLVSTDTVFTALDTIRSIDYTAFYRETIYSNKEYDITKEYLQLEILPDIIFLPCIGTRGIMWQEIEGKRRNTPARIMLPILSMTDITTTLIRLTGEFRWEMCKRIQGSRWNDISEHSLTSDYCDYIQFYRKNYELSADAKEKIKLSLTHSRNSFKECFVQDYILYIMFEGKGSPRLNKVARTILFSYCSFTKEICEQLQSNPLYTDNLNRHNIKKKQAQHHYNLLVKKIENGGHAVPPEITSQEIYLNG